MTPSASIIRDPFGSRRQIPEPRDHAREQRFPWSVAVAIKLYEGLNVLLPVRSLAVRKPFPLISNEPLEASTTVKEGSVKIESRPPISCRVAPTANQTNPDRAGFLTSIHAPTALSR